MRSDRKGRAMLYKCANEACSVPFRRLREGKLFQVETEYFAQPNAAGAQRRRPWRRVEHYWLCDACSAYITLTFDRERGVVTVPLPDGMGKRMITLVEPSGREGGIDQAPPMDEVQKTLREVAK